MIEQIAKLLQVSEKSAEHLLYSIVALLIYIAFRLVTNSIIRRQIKDEKRSYSLRKTFSYVYGGVLIFSVGSIWLNGMQSVGNFSGIDQCRSRDCVA